MRRTTLALQFALLFFGTALSTSAAILTVTNLNDSGLGSLRQAIADAANGDAIDFATNLTGTITLMSAPLSIEKSIRINGPGPTKLTISGNNSRQVFFVPSGFVTLAGLTIANGYDSWAGGGILTYSSSTLTVSNCIVTANRAQSGGGGICSYGGLALVNSIVCANLNGGISNGSWGIVINSSIFDNTNATIGGGIATRSSPPFAWLFVSNSTISGNVGLLGGGGVYTRHSNSVIVSSTICSNFAGLPPVKSGGGILAPTNTILLNSIVAGNSGSSPDCSGIFNSLGCNLVQNTNGATFTNVTANNIYNLDPKLGPLADGGGPTPTHALRFDSPALDAGRSGGLATDQRGSTRTIDDFNITNTADGTDIGAYETDFMPRFTGIETVGDDIRLHLNTVFGRTYQLESDDSLGAAWSVLSSNILGSGSSAQAIAVGVPSAPQQFYRAAVLLP